MNTQQNPNINLFESSILVTGGAGFIGSHIVEFLLKNGAKFVRVLDNLSTGSKSNIDFLLQQYSNVEFVWGDIRNLEACRDACRNINMICHQAALGSIPRSIDYPLNSHEVNVNGMVNMLIAAQEHGIKRFVYASSSSVYGTNNEPTKIEAENGEPLSPYAVTKCVGELYASIFTKVYHLECIGLRYFNVFGPRQDPNGVYAAVIPKFIKLMSNGIAPTINGDGTYSRDFTYVDNIVYANFLALTTTNANCFGEVFNVGTNNSISINKLYQSLKKLTNYTGEVIHGPNRLGDVPYSNASISKISEMLGYKPMIYFDEGLEKTVKFFLRCRKELSKLSSTN